MIILKDEEGHPFAVNPDYITAIYRHVKGGTIIYTTEFEGEHHCENSFADVIGKIQGRSEE